MKVDYQGKYSLSNWKEDVQKLIYSNEIFDGFELESPALMDITDRYWDFKNKSFYKKSVYLRTRFNRSTSENIITLRSYQSLDASLVRLSDADGRFRLSTSKEILNYLSDYIKDDIVKKTDIDSFFEVLETHMFNFVEVWNRRASRGVYVKDKKKPEMKKIGSINIDNYVAFSGSQAFHSYELEINIFDEKDEEGFRDRLPAALSKTLTGALTEIEEPKLQQVVNKLQLT